MRLSDHKVLITGGSAGIGLALARAFASRGNRVLIALRSADRLEAAAREEPGLHTATCDVRREDQIRQLIEQAGATLGGLSILVNNAGIQWNDTYGETDAETVLTHVDEEIGVNLTALVKLSALAIPLLRQEQESAIVNVSSVLALTRSRAPPSTAPRKPPCARSPRRCGTNWSSERRQYGSSKCCRPWWTRR
ncbi:MAG: SDR family NAD(P)-dependent oxidoreductase [Gemmatimonadota bacterium]|nr:SDR family NAD(P)-dependent oxidoreductase [Gemmatimonadota bacterium]MDH3368434.1 SDR family NAD(P)-dependent oxidoreductase [Gemmatimonadota bacterium]MDH3477342.1 SDR family NAD(P)-dependent oxidoreductase [Gemmatimonadota bacterium]MDH3568923.1 SDR family NAD(P)-dependent oxidoreductase [Gemmatimonadota bacterium]